MTIYPAMRRNLRLVTVNDKMQRGYRYPLVVPTGRNFDPAFRPELTPKKMLELGVFCGKYMTEGVPSQLVHTGQVVNELPRLLPQLFWRGCQSAAVSLAGEGLDSSRRSARMVPMVLPLLYGPADARRGCASDQAVERYAPPCGPDQTPLRTG